MKKILIITALVFYAGASSGQAIQKDMVFTLNVLNVDLKSGATMKQFTDIIYEEYIPALKEAYPDVTSIFSEIIRGDTKFKLILGDGYDFQFGLIDLYESEEGLEKYWPETNVMSELYEERWDSLVKPVSQKMNELADYEFLPLTTWKVDFTPEEEDSALSFLKDKVFTRHVVPVDLKPGISMDHFLEVVYEEYLPALKEAFPDVSFLFLKGLRGGHGAHFGLIPIYESEEGLEKYWPASGGSSELFDERWTEIVKPVRDSMDVLAEYKFLYYTIWKIEPTIEETTVNSVVSARHIDFSAYPNPFTDHIVFDYELPQAENFSIQVYNSLGQLVATLVNTMQQSGKNSMLWNGCDNSGNPLKEGVYFVRVQTSNAVRSIVRVIKLAK